MHDAGNVNPEVLGSNPALVQFSLFHPNNVVKHYVEAYQVAFKTTPAAALYIVK